MFRSYKRWPLRFVFLALLAGCGKPPIAHVPVTGQITLDGRPVPGLGVAFNPTGDTPGDGGRCVTRDDGHYQLSALRGQAGVVAGTYDVTIAVVPGGILKMNEAEQNTPPTPATIAQPENLPSQSVKGKFTDRIAKISAVEVPETGVQINFQLSKTR